MCDLRCDIIQMSDPPHGPTLDYAAPGRRKDGRRARAGAGIISLLLCIVQLLWLPVAGLIGWWFLWGDNEPRGGDLFLANVFISAPSMVAVILGTVAIWRVAPDRTLGVLGIVSGCAWIVWNAC